jgi:ABC-type tungstate transport system permease subunit
VKLRVAFALVSMVAVLALLASGASADTVGKVTIVGPGEPVESGLFANVIEPQFEQAFPQYELSYSPSAQKSAAERARSGLGGPSVLILHEPKLEREFVGAGSSYENRFGSAVFYSDDILVGTTGDGAGVLAAGGSHDIARAFAAVAAAGAAGEAAYYSRGGTTTASTVTIAEHAIWKLVSESGLTPPGVYLCTVSVADGGGMSPTIEEFAGAGCPDSGTVSQSHAPPWYFIDTGANQASNLTATNTCTAVIGVTHCYALSDRATFDFMLTGGKGPTETLPNLAVASAEQAAGAPGGVAATLAAYHAYVINPATLGETVNLAGAQALVSFLTAPAEQAQIGAYLRSAPRSLGAPVSPDAAPGVTAAPSESSVGAGGSITVSGSVADPEPGYPGLGGQTVVVRAVGGGQAGSGLIDASGGYSVSFVPPASGSYEVATGEISRLVEPTAAPPFGDQLAPAASAPFAVTVNPAQPTESSTAPSNPPTKRAVEKSVKIGKVTVKSGTVTVSAALGSPASRGATLSLLVEPRVHAKHRGHPARASRVKGGPKFKKVAGVPVAAGKSAATIKHKLRPGSYLLKLSYTAPGVTTVVSAPRRVQVPRPHRRG